MSLVTTNGAFDYGAISANVAEVARAAADRIRAHERKAQDTLWEIGRELIGIKESLGHGHFLRWIEAEFGMTRSTAHRYMSVAANIPAKCRTVRHLPPKALQAIAKPTTPPDVRRELIERIEGGEQLKPYEICDVVKEATQAERKTQKAARLKPDKKKAQARADRAKEKAEAKWREDQEAEKVAAQAAVDFLRDCLGNEFDAFVDLMRGVSHYRFREALLQG